VSDRRQVIQDAIDGRLTAREAARLLGLTERHIRRLKRRFRQRGADAVEPARHLRRGPRKLTASVRQRILELARDNPGLNDTQLHEILATRENLAISRESLRQVLRQAGWSVSESRREKRFPARASQS
jgi:transposase